MAFSVWVNFRTPIGIFKLQHLRLQVVSTDDLKDDSEFAEIVEDMREECGKYGKYMVGVLIHILLRMFPSMSPSLCAVYHKLCFSPSLAVVVTILLQRSIESSNRIAGA